MAVGSFRFALVVALAAAVLLDQRAAHAYVDAGTGSYMLQWALAGVFAGLFGLKLFWRELTRRFGGRTDKAGEDDGPEHPTR